MPNHIKNRIELNGPIKSIDALIKQFSTYHKASIERTHDGKRVILRSDDSFCWFDLKTGETSNRSGYLQIGIPDGFDIDIKDSFTEFPDFTKVIPPPDDPAYRDEPRQDVAKLSPNWWYTWNIANWGTKWSAYACDRESINIFTFETAWAGVPKIINRISLAFPEVQIEYAWADEDTGSNCGRSSWMNGLVSEFIPENQSVEAYRIAFDLRPDLKEDYELVDGRYKYKEL